MTCPREFFPFCYQSSIGNANRRLMKIIYYLLIIIKLLLTKIYACDILQEEVKCMLETQKDIVRARCADIGTLLRVLFWITAALVVVSLVYGTWLLFQPAEMLVEHFSLGVSWTGTEGWRGAVRFACGVSFWWSTLFWIVIAGILWLGCAIFRGIDRQGTPFLPCHVRAVRGIGLLVMALGLLRGSLPELLYTVCGFALERQETLLRGGVRIVMEAGGGSLINWNYLLLGGVVLCLSYAFAYGAHLQQEADETL